MALEQKLNLRLSQRLIMTPSLQQAIKLLQMTKLELQEEVTQELTENPLLEEMAEGQTESDKTDGEENAAADGSVSGETADPSEPEAGPADDKDSFEEIDYESYFQDYMDMSYAPQFRAETEEQEARPLDAVLSKPQNLTDHLFWQLDMTVISPRQKEIARAIIGNLDEDGYLQASIDEIIAMGSYSSEEVELALHLVQASPLDHKVGSQWSFMTATANIPGKAAQSVAHAAQFKTQMTTFSEKFINLDLEISACAHVALPGQGRATARKPSRSTRA
jgi:RNA polymerase sigma-54 factor